MNESNIFDVAIELTDPDDRRRYLEKACADNAQLRERVERLLRHAEKNDSFMELRTKADDHDSIASIRVGSRLGPYKLKEKIGEGGMGVVYVAEQKEPVKRRVALKVIKPGMDSKQVLARFEAERQALALMEHPNIARVLDAGTTEQGLPYFVMELVNGTPINRYCDDNLLTIRERLELFRSVCEGVQHAHQKGIIHRDLKPSNVLVAQYDGRPVPKVIDFGVAKASGQALLDYSIYTQLGQVVGTLEYMSPEQSQRNQLDIDTRSDIYSLGVVLYELLTGELPFDKRRLREAALDELFRIIREEEPPRPSTRYSSSDSKAETARNRKSEPSRLGSLFRGELDWIVMKAMDKDRHRRYETANGLAQDIARHLANESVQACPPSTRYRLKKLWQRNRTAILLTGLVSTLLILATGISVWLAVQARDSEQFAKTKEQETQAINQQLSQKIAEVRTAKSEADRAFQSALQSQAQSERNFMMALAGLRQFLVEFSDRTFTRSANSEGQQQRWLAKAVNQFEELTRTNPDRDDLKRSYGEVLLELGKVSIQVDDSALAVKSFLQSAEVWEGMLADQPAPDLRDVAETQLVHVYEGVGLALSESDPANADEYYLKSIGVAERRHARNRSTQSGKFLAMALNHYGIFLVKRQREDEALNRFQLALENTDPVGRGAVLHNIARIHRDRGELDKALDLVDQAIAIRNQPEIWIRNHQSLKAKLHVAKNEYEQAEKPCGIAISMTESMANALRQFEGGELATHIRSSGYDSESKIESLIKLYQLHARILAQLGDDQNAAKRLERALLVFDWTHGERLLRSSRLQQRADICDGLAESYEELGRADLAQQFRDSAVKSREHLQQITPAAKGRSFVIAGSGPSFLSGVAVDQEGSIITAGHVPADTDFDPGQLYRGAPDFSGAIAVKHSAGGMFKWATPLAARVKGMAKAVATDVDGNIFVTGALYVKNNEFVAFARHRLSVPTIGDGPITFVVKLDPGGEILWARWAGRGTGSDSLGEHHIAVAPDGGVLVGGTYQSDSLIGTEKQHQILKYRAKGNDPRRGYVARFDSAGNVEWVRAIEADEKAAVSGIACGSSGDIFLAGAGRPAGSITFGQPADSGNVDMRTLEHAEHACTFVMKMNSLGELQWVRPQVSAHPKLPFGIAVDKFENLYLASWLTGTMDLDGVQDYPDNIDLVSRYNNIGAFETNISCWNNEGKLLWANSLICRSGKFQTYGVAPRPDGGLFLASFVNSVGLWYGEQKLRKFHPVGGKTGVLVEIDSQGNLKNDWYYTSGSRSTSRPQAIATNEQHPHVAIIGHFSGRIRTPTGEFLDCQGSDGFVTVMEPE